MSVRPDEFRHTLGVLSCGEIQSLIPELRTQAVTALVAELTALAGLLFAGRYWIDPTQKAG